MTWFTRMKVEATNDIASDDLSQNGGAAYPTDAKPQTRNGGGTYVRPKPKPQPYYEPAGSLPPVV